MDEVNENRVYVGNLPFSVGFAGLKKLFCDILPALKG